MISLNRLLKVSAVRARGTSLDAADPVTLAAWTNWRVNLLDHWYEDGTGRTVDMITGFIMARRNPGIDEFLFGGKPAKIAIPRADQVIVLDVPGFQVEIPQ